jgi:hypothetical protein
MSLTILLYRIFAQEKLRISAKFLDHPIGTVQLAANSEIAEVPPSGLVPTSR